MDRKSLSYRFWLFLICALCSLVFIIRISGPTDLESYAQVLNIGYILDLMTQGHWLVQYDLESAIMSKPPLHTWLMAPFTALFGLNRLALALPSFLSILGLALLLLETGRRRFGLEPRPPGPYRRDQACSAVAAPAIPPNTGGACL